MSGYGVRAGIRALGARGSGSNPGAPTKILRKRLSYIRENPWPKFRDLCVRAQICNLVFKMAFLRFVVGKLDQNSRRRQGVFHAFADLRDSDSLFWYEVELAIELRDWFNEHLARPSRFSISRRGILRWMESRHLLVSRFRKGSYCQDP